MPIVLPSFAGTAVAPASGSSFENGYSAEFDGTNDYCGVGSDPGLSVYALSCWFKADSFSTNPMLVSGFGGTAYTTYGGIGVSLTGDIRWNDGYAGSSSGSGFMSTGTWHHYLINYVDSGYTDLDGTASNNGKGYQIWIDGVRKDQTLGSTSWNFSLMTTTDKFKVGREGERQTYLLNGLVDEVAIFGSSLSASDIATIYNSGTPTDLTDYSPTLWWRMGDNDSGTGTTVTDQGSGSNDGTLTNRASFSTSSLRPATDFNRYSVKLNGSNQYVDVNSGGTLGTLSFWVKPDSTVDASTGLEVPIGFLGPSGPYPQYGGIHFGSSTSSVTNEIISLVTGDWIYCYADASATIDTNWHHVAVRWTGSDYEIYLDGTQVKNTDGQWGSGSKAEIDFTKLEFGRRGESSNYFGGNLDEIAFWDSALTASQIVDIYNSGAPADVSSLSPNGYWRMGDNNSGTGTTITDQGSDSNDATTYQLTTPTDLIDPEVA